jgi:hypothetical protein
MDGTRPARAAGAALAGLLVLAGTAVVAVAVASGPGPALTGYVSEAGSGPYAAAYRLGVLGLAAGILLVALTLALAGTASAGTATAAVRAATGLLGAGGLCAALSGAVTCSAGCPLPPYERATAADVVHGGASILAVAACVFAMLAVAAAAPVPPGVRRLSAGAAVVALPLSAVVGVAMLAIGRGALVGVTERLLLGVVAAWLVALAAWLAYFAGSGAALAGPEVEAEAGRRS